MRKTSPGLWRKHVLAQRMQDDLHFQKFHPGVESESGVVACSAYGISAEVGAEVLRMGGNAMDAGLATALTQIAFSCGDYVSFAGVMSALYYSAREGRVHSIDATWNIPRHETDPRSIPHMTVPGDGRTALVPGFMAGVDACIRRFGTMELADLLEPAIFFAEEGFQLEKMGKHIQEKKELLSRFPETRTLFLKPDGEAFGPGDWYRQPRLAQTLKTLASEGAGYMYRGEWAHHFVETIQAAGGRITLEDMANYRAEITEPRRTELFGFEACTNAGRIYGGDAILTALKALEVDDTARLGHYSESGRALVRFCQALAYFGESSNADTGVKASLTAAERAQRRKAIFGDAFEGDNPLSKRNIELYWKAIDEGRFAPDSMSSAQVSTHSDCIAVADKFGNMLCMTHTANQAFFGNTGLSVDGIMITDSAAHQQAAMAAVEPGTRLAAPLPPIMICKRGAPLLAISAIGMGLMEKSISHLYNVLAFDMDIVQAQHAPSVMGGDGFAFFAGSPDPSVFVDEVQFKPDVLAEARRLSLRIKDWSQASAIYDVNGGPMMEGFTVAVQGKDGKNLAVGVNWMNSKAVAERTETVNPLIFMSPEHIRLLNERVNQSLDVRAACARLPRDIRIAYQLHDEDGGSDIWWQVLYSQKEGCILALGAPQGPVDASLEAGYWTTLQQTEAAIRGSAKPDEVAAGVASLTGQAAAAEAHAQAWLVGLMIDVEFPQRGRDLPPR
jgi:gamma-glutamyltranspeptidase/glutathione hydrolase